MATPSNGITVKDNDLIGSRSLGNDAMDVFPLSVQVQILFGKSGPSFDFKVVAFREKNAYKILEKHGKMVKDEVVALGKEVLKLKEDDANGDAKAFDKAKALIKKCLNQIDILLEDKLIAALKADVQKWSDVNPNKMEAVAAIGFRCNGDGIQIPRGVFKGGAEEEEETADLLKEMKKSPTADRPLHFAFAEGSESRLILGKLKVKDGQKREAKEKCTGFKHMWDGVAFKEGNAWVFKTDDERSVKSVGPKIKKCLKARLGKSYTVIARSKLDEDLAKDENDVEEEGLGADSISVPSGTAKLKFYFAEDSQGGGLITGGSISASDKKDADAECDRVVKSWEGEVGVAGGIWVFEIKEAPKSGLAKKLQESIKEQAKKSVKVTVRGGGREDKAA
ncbi:MAG: hypothetical protein AB7Q97_08575 [Gammaproteobacteria bacterium]